MIGPASPHRNQESTDPDGWTTFPRRAAPDSRQDIRLCRNLIASAPVNRIARARSGKSPASCRNRERGQDDARPWVRAIGVRTVPIRCRQTGPLLNRLQESSAFVLRTLEAPPRLPRADRSGSPAAETPGQRAGNIRIAHRIQPELEPESARDARSRASRRAAVVHAQHLARLGRRGLVVSGFNRTLNVKKKAPSNRLAEEARKTRRWWHGRPRR